MPNIELTDDELKLVDESLRHLAAYRRVQDRDERPLLVLAERLQTMERKAAATVQPVAKRKRA